MALGFGSYFSVLEFMPTMAYIPYSNIVQINSGIKYQDFPIFKTLCNSC